MIDSHDHLRPIGSEGEVRRAQQLIERMLEDPGNFRSQWVAEHDWTVVPVDSPDHFTQRDTRLLSLAFRHLGHSECLAVATEPLDNTPLYFKLPTTEAGLREFNQAAWAYFFALVPEDGSCAVLCTKNDYYLIAGPQDFVAAAIEGSIAEARASFAAFAENAMHPTMKEILRDVSTRYAPKTESRDGKKPGQLG